MALDSYASLLEELGKLLEIKLKPDANNSCLIKFPDDLELQIDLDISGAWILIGTTIATVPPGAYREEVLREALKGNYILEPHCGCFAWAKKGDRLVFNHRMPVEHTKGIHLAEVIIPMLERVKSWKEMITNNEIPVVRSQQSTGKPGGLFGLTP